MSEEKDLPAGWEQTTLGEIRGDWSKSVEPNKLPEQLFELYSVPSFESRTPEIVLGSNIGSNKQSIEPGTVLLCKINPRINRAWVVGNFSDYPKIASTEWIPFFKFQGIESRYLCHYLTLQTFRDYLAANVSGVGGSLMRINERTFADYSFPLAPLKEQQRIVAAIEQQFTRLDKIVETLQRDRTKLKHTRSAILKSAVEGRLTETWRAEHPTTETASQLLQRILAARRAKWEAEQVAKMQAQGKTPKDDTWKEGYREPAGPDTENLPELPEEWCWATVEQLAAAESNAITDGPFGSNLKTEHYTNSGARVIRLQNVGEGEFKDEKSFISWEHFETLGKHQVFAGDLVIVTLSENPPRSCIIPDFVGPAIVKADCIRYKVSPYTLNTFVNYALNAKPTRERTASKLHGIGRPRLNLAEIKAIVIPLPPLAEQEQIVAEVERRLSVISQSEAAIAANLKRAERLRQSILQKAFSGRLVPQDPRDEPANMLLERIRQERARREQEEKLLGKERHMQRKIKKDATRKPLYELLVEAQKPLKPEDLFKRAELKPDAPEDIDEFCEEVREEAIVNKRINILRPDTTQVYLEAVKE